MSILTAHNLAQSFGRHDVFSGISGKIEQTNKIGLVGPNGIGKTSLLRILAGLDRPRIGRIQLAGSTRIGYLDQEAVLTFADRNHTLQQEMLTVFAHLQEMSRRMRAIEDRMAEGDMADALYAEYSELLEAYEHGGGYTYEQRIAQTLLGLGFTDDDRETPLGHLSGGQKTRALLARLLLEDPDLLMLDEPTNHLDVQAIEWLEKTLKQRPGALLIVSHDRYFLDRVANIMWEMSPTDIDVYRGNYSAYAKQRVERWARRQKEFEAKKDRLDKEMAFIYKHIGSGRGRNMAYGKLRRVSSELGTQGRALKVSRAKEKMKEMQSPNGEWHRMKMEMDVGHRSTKLVLRTRNLQVGYEQPLFTADDIKLQRGECAALMGPNGAGKTTFIRTILDEMPALAGSHELGDNLRIGYFAQAHDNLDASRTVIEEFLHQRPSNPQQPMDMGAARNFLARYLFVEDDVFKRVRHLSGGERGRLALAILAQQGANFLLLDEPTNHLDLPAQEVLQRVLEAYDGTILLISHDRYLVDRLATQVWQIGDGRLQVFEGRYREFTNRRGTAVKPKLRT